MIVSTSLLLSFIETKMDPQKDLQPPKQQPMIYICGGNVTLQLLVVFIVQSDIISVTNANDATRPTSCNSAAAITSSITASTTITTSVFGV